MIFSLFLPLAEPSRDQPVHVPLNPLCVGFSRTGLDVTKLIVMRAMRQHIVDPFDILINSPNGIRIILCFPELH